MEKRTALISIAVCASLVLLAAFLGRAYRTSAQEATSTPAVEGVDVQPDGTEIINVADLPLEQQPFKAPLKISSLKAYLETLDDSTKLDLILNKVTFIATQCAR